MTSLNVTITITGDDAAIGRISEGTENALNRGLDKILVAVELTQILKYTTGAFPAPPRGSTYRRTFKTRRASRTGRTERRLPNISGQWWIDEDVAPWAEELMGPRSKQAAIHAGRWLSEEEIAEQAEQFGPAILDEELRSEQF